MVGEKKLGDTFYTPINWHIASNHALWEQFLSLFFSHVHIKHKEYTWRLYYSRPQFTMPKVYFLNFLFTNSPKKGRK